MYDLRPTRRRPLALVIAAAAVLALLATLAGPASALERYVIPLSGGVDDGGGCLQVSGDGTTQTWTFVVDHIYTNQTAARLSASFDDGTTVTDQAPTSTDDTANTATWVVETAAGANVIDAGADVTDSSPDGATLNVVSCVLSGEATTTTTSTTVAPTTTTTATVAPAVVETTTTAAPVAVTPAATELPRTGSSSAPLAAIGFALLAAGGLLAFRTRRSASTR